MEHLGTGLMLHVDDRSELPTRAIQLIDGVELAVQIPSQVYRASRERLIDVDETTFSNLTLR